jgi:altronate hydrolase
VVPDGEVRFGFPDIDDNAEIAELMACGAHLACFVIGRGSVVGSAISPVPKIRANPGTHARMADDMDVDAGRVLRGTPLAEVGAEIHAGTLKTAAGARTRSEALGHREFVLTYKTFEPLGPACPPAA